MSKEQTSDQKDSLRMVLIGKTGAGKSAAGNTILMEKVFKSSLSVSSVTKGCQRGTGKVQGQTMEVIDTPGLFDTELSEKEVKAEIAKCIIYAAPGPQVFLIVLKADRFTKEEQDTVKILQKLFGEQAACYTMALFTRGDDLEEEGRSIEDVIGKNKVHSDFLDQCKGGYHVFNNRNKDPAQVHELLKKINTMVKKNGGRYYTNEMFRRAEKDVEKKTTEFLKKINTRDEGNRRSYSTREMVPRHFDLSAVRSQAKESVAANADVHLAVLGAGVGAGIGAGVGAVFGAGIGGAVGAPIGAAVGAGVGFVAEAVKNKECVIQ